VLGGLPFLLGLTAAGALLALAVFACLALSPAGVYCVVFAMDENMVCQQRVIDRVGKQKVADIIAEWVGGQSQPFLRFQPVIGSEFETVRSIRANSERDLILIRDAAGTNRIYLERQQFEPVLNYMIQHCPKAKVYLQQVWSYENGGPQLTGWTNYKDTDEMFADTKASYDKAVIDSGVNGLIPSGEVMLELMHGGFKVHRDGFHASLGIGRYAIALTWFCRLTGRSADDVTFRELDVPITEEEIAAAKAAVKTVMERYN
jgi:hypothetical protein